MHYLRNSPLKSMMTLKPGLGCNSRSLDMTLFYNHRAAAGTRVVNYPDMAALITYDFIFRFYSNLALTCTVYEI